MPAHRPLIAMALLAAGSAGAAHAPPPADAAALGGHLEATVDGRRTVLPVLRADVDAKIDGDLASVTITQTFLNRAPAPINATYVFPLHEDAAVVAMVMRLGDEVIRAEVARTAEARQTFEEARDAGRSAALLRQYRPNVFTQEIANLMPGQPIEVSIRYVHAVPRRDGAYRLEVPLVVGPRYRGDAPPAPPASAGARRGAATGEWELCELPAVAPVFGLTVPETVDRERVAVSVDLATGISSGSISSPSHRVVIEARGSERASVRLGGGRTIDNRDFVLVYTLAGDETQAAVSAHRGERGGFFSLLIEPPALPRAEQIAPRELVFVLDCSGSMAGAPLAASKELMRTMLTGLRPSDSFRIIRFAKGASELATRPLPATPANVARGLTYTDSLQGGGGTHMARGVERAFAVAPVPGSVRLVVFLTDGYIGNEVAVLARLRRQLGSARVFALGVGTSVNRFLLTEMARVGRGLARIVDPTENAGEVAHELAAHLATPVLTDIEIDWGSVAPVDVVPAQIPDLFSGQALRIQGRYEQPGIFDIVVRGQVGDRDARLPLRVELPAETDGPSAIAALWARAAIADAMAELALPVELRRAGAADAVLRRRVTELGLDHSLTTRWTSFVAVSERIVNPEPEATLAASVPVPMPAGVGTGAYGRTPPAKATPPPVNIAYATTPNRPTTPAPTPRKQGNLSSTPEPATTAGLLLAATAAALSRARRRRRRGGRG